MKVKAKQQAKPGKAAAIPQVVHAPPPLIAQPPADAAPAARPPQPPAEPRPDYEEMSHNMVRLIDGGNKALAAYLKPREGRAMEEPGADMTDAFKTLGKVVDYWIADPQRAMQAQAALSGQFIRLWSETLGRMSGQAAPARTEAVDKRFADPDWRSLPFFDFLRQSYAITTQWADSLVGDAEDLDPHTRQKAHFYMRQLSGALSPSNFLPTNPQLLKETLAQNGANLVRGVEALALDIEAGRIRQADDTAFELGVNMAVTPGKVVYRNALIELIQYTPTTPTVYARPLLITPPWINKFYILDLNPEKSLVRWAVAQGLTVFVISWVNPDARHAAASFEDYMREGVLAALDGIEQAIGAREVATIGYCVGGTLMAVTLAYLAAKGDKRIIASTLFTTQVDFTEPGDLGVFVDEAQIASLEAKMEANGGVLDGAKMANAFNMLRPNDLIWSYVVNNYVKGQAPLAFDLLVWNSDSTRMPAANHSFYLRNCYMHNTLSRGEMVVGGVKLDLKQVTIPIYNLATREDHIAPAKSVFTGAQCFGGPMRYVLSGSGHIAGVVNPADKPKYQYWTGGPPSGRFEDWVAAATEHKGSWWPDWLAWLTPQLGPQAPARVPGAGGLKPLCDAPGEYVRVRA